MRELGEARPQAHELAGLSSRRRPRANPGTRHDGACAGVIQVTLAAVTESLSTTLQCPCVNGMLTWTRDDMTTETTVTLPGLCLRRRPSPLRHPACSRRSVSRMRPTITATATTTTTTESIPCESVAHHADRAQVCGSLLRLASSARSREPGYGVSSPARRRTWRRTRRRPGDAVHAPSPVRRTCRPATQRHDALAGCGAGASASLHWR